MRLEEAWKVLEFGAPRQVSREHPRKLREAQLVVQGHLTEDEIRGVLETEFGPLD